MDGRAFITCDVKELGMCVWVSMWVGGLLCAENLKLYYFKNFKSIILRHIPKIPLNSNSISSINQNQTCTSILHYQHTLPRYRTHQSPSPPSHPLHTLLRYHTHQSPLPPPHTTPAITLTNHQSPSHTTPLSHSPINHHHPLHLLVCMCCRKRMAKDRGSPWCTTQVMSVGMGEGGGGRGERRGERMRGRVRGWEGGC